MKRPGYYVEGRFFRDNINQARARAAHLAAEYGRGVDIVRVPTNFEGVIMGGVVATVFNGKARSAA